MKSIFYASPALPRRNQIIRKLSQGTSMIHCLMIYTWGLVRQLRASVNMGSIPIWSGLSHSLMSTFRSLIFALFLAAVLTSLYSLDVLICASRRGIRAT
ncbi:hypothetical protein EDB19DRAFT_78665 [Suillus lakei]|nr:hypothetical protein EDB19DRAFT_78665 [Suillus lakei]